MRSLFIKTLIPFMRAPLSCTNYLPKAHIWIPPHWGLISLQHMNSIYSREHRVFLKHGKLSEIDNGISLPENLSIFEPIFYDRVKTNIAWKQSNGLEWFSNLSVHPNHLESFLKHRFLAPGSRVSDPEVFVWSLIMYIYDKSPGDVHAAILGTTFWEPLVKT